MRTLIVSTAILVLAACSSVTSDSVVTGTWGARNAELRGTSTSFAIELSCMIVEINRPALLSNDGRYAVEGKTSGGVSFPSADTA